MIEALAENSELRRKISLNARKVAGYYTFGRMVKKIESFLEAGL
jgi:hypothetical protein